MAAAGAPDLSALDVMVMHTVNRRERANRLSDKCFTRNVENTHLFNFALKKLVKAGSVTATKHGDEVHYDASEDGTRFANASAKSAKPV